MLNLLAVDDATESQTVDRTFIYQWNLGQYSSAFSCLSELDQLVFS